jgi:pSer/pThr/pTyr-binding forkhead associated (FHA) protein
MVARGGSKGKTLKLRSAETLVGRGKGCDVRIPSAAVSRRHCRLSFRDGYVLVEDLDSANGTYVNGAQVKKHPVRPGDRLEVGPLAFVVKYELSSRALEKLRRQEEESFELVDVEAADDAPVVEVEAADDEIVDVEAVEVDTAEVNTGKVTKKDKHDKAKPPKKKDDKSKAKEEDNVAVELEGGASWQAGDGGDVRDILSQLE